jgi:arylformamidase
MGGAVAGAVALTSSPGSAQRCPAPPRAKGPPVWLDMDQQELDDAYSQIAYAPFWRETNSVRDDEANIVAAANIDAPLRIPYGNALIEKVLVFRTRRPNAPTLIWIHGGAWLDGSADFPALAEVFIKAGANLASIEFNNVKETNGDLLPMADQCRRAVATVYRTARNFGGDPNIRTASISWATPQAAILAAACLRRTGPNKDCPPTSSRAPFSPAACTT